MRDPKRIEKVIGKLRQLWQSYPDQRLGQLVINLAPNGADDLWSMEEPELEKKIDGILEHGWNGASLR